LVGIRLRELRREDWRGVVLQVFSQQFSVAQASAGVRSRLAGIGGQKTKRTQARLWKFSFFESHIRATNAPARRSSIMTRYSAALRLPTLGYTFVFPFGHALSHGCSPLRSGCLLRSRSCRPSGCLRQAISTFPKGLDCL